MFLYLKNIYIYSVSRIASSLASQFPLYSKAHARPSHLDRSGGESMPRDNQARRNETQRAVVQGSRKIHGSKMVKADVCIFQALVIGGDTLHESLDEAA